MSSAWFRPNCAVVEKLSADSQFRCNNLDWSDPIFEQVIGYYMTPGTAAAVTTHADLQGKTICRPAGYSTYMLEEKDLVAPFVTLATPASPADCFEGLASGAYDAVVLAAEVANDAIAAQGLTGRVIAHDALAGVATLHLVTAKTNPRGKEKLELFNTGLRALRNDGEWFNIVSRHMAAHQAKSGS
jgi:polar amino acid transport system substrate-binding protein